MEMRAASVIDKKSEKKKLLEEAIFILKSRLKTLRYAVQTNDPDLWNFAETSIVDVLEDPKYRLPGDIRERFSKLYHNTIPGEELSMKLTGLRDSEEVVRGYYLTPSFENGKRINMISKERFRGRLHGGMFNCSLDVRDFESGEDYLDIENLELRGEGDD